MPYWTTDEPEPIEVSSEPLAMTVPAIHGDMDEFMSKHTEDFHWVSEGDTNDDLVYTITRSTHWVSLTQRVGFPTLSRETHSVPRHRNLYA